MTQTAQAVDLQEIPGQGETGNSLFRGNLDLIKGIEVTLSVVVGRSRLTVEQLFALKEGSSVKLEAAVADPVELYLDGKLVGRGELVAVDDNFGIRISEINTAAR
jgi:flagellar motor switch protein FliN/FliY